MSITALAFALNIGTVVAFVAFHIIVGRLLLAYASPKFTSANSQWLRRGIVAAILFMDVPLLYLLIFYKHYHPLVADQVMNGISLPYLILHANALLLGGGLVLYHYLLRPIRIRKRRRAHALANSEDDSTTNVEQASPVAPGGASGNAETVVGIPQTSIALITPRTSATPYNTSVLDPGGILSGRRQFLRTSALAATGLVASGAILYGTESRNEFQIEKVVVKIPNLPRVFKGTSIAMVGDIHSSVFMQREDMETYVKAMMALKADMVFVVGDFVNSKLHEVYPFAEAFSRLRAPLGVYGVTGNHDYYTRDIETVAREVEQAGIRLLRNQNLAVEKNGERLWLMGMDDDDIYDIRDYLDAGKTERGTIENLVKGIPDNAARIFLCHKPYPFEEYSQLGMDLMLSGHTHGGQVVIAQLDSVNLSFAALASKYIAGLYKARSNPATQLYVTRGVGTVGVPLRLNCPPEITHIILV